MSRPRVVFCKYEHDVAILGRRKQGNCNACLISTEYKSKRAIVVSKYRRSPKGKDGVKSYAASWRISKKGKISNAKYQKERRKKDIQFKLAGALRTRLGMTIKYKSKSGSSVRDLGCSIPELIEYFKPLFQKGMSWENHGAWEIDHIIPLTAFDLTDPEQLKKACHFTNLQPLWKLENRIKGSRSKQ